MIIIPEVITFNVHYFIIFTIKLIFNDFGFGLTDIFESDEWRDFHFFFIFIIMDKFRSRIKQIVTKKSRQNSN